MIDIEAGGHTDLLVNKKAIAAYRQRLERLQEGLAGMPPRSRAPRRARRRAQIGDALPR